jgi:hypothetical protein
MQRERHHDTLGHQWSRSVRNLTDAQGVSVTDPRGGLHPAIESKQLKKCFVRAFFVANNLISITMFIVMIA